MSKGHKPSPDTVGAQPQASIGPDSAFRVLVIVACANDALLLVQLLEHLGATVDLPDKEGAAFCLPERFLQTIALIDTDSDAGFHALQEIAARRESLHLMALATNATAERITELRQAGADAVLAKPVMEIDALARAIAPLRAEASPDDPAASATPSLPPAVASQLPALLQLAGKAHARELLDEMLRDLERIRASLRDAAQTRNLERIRTETHVLIALAGTAGAQSLQLDAEAFNRAAHPPASTELTALADRVEHGLTPLIAEIRTARAPLLGPEHI